MNLRRINVRAVSFVSSLFKCDSHFLTCQVITAILILKITTEYSRIISFSLHTTLISPVFTPTRIYGCKKQNECNICRVTNTLTPMDILLSSLFIFWQAQFSVHSHSFVFTFSRYSCVIIWISINYRGLVAAPPACQLPLYFKYRQSLVRRDLRRLFAAIAENPTL